MYCSADLESVHGFRCYDKCQRVLCTRSMRGTVQWRRCERAFTKRASLRYAKSTHHLGHVPWQSRSLSQTQARTACEGHFTYRQQLDHSSQAVFSKRRRRHDDFLCGLVAGWASATPRATQTRRRRRRLTALSTAATGCK